MFLYGALRLLILSYFTYPLYVSCLRLRAFPSSCPHAELCRDNYCIIVVWGFVSFERTPMCQYNTSYIFANTIYFSFIIDKCLSDPRLDNLYLQTTENISISVYFLLPFLVSRWRRKPWSFFDLPICFLVVFCEYPRPLWLNISPPACLNALIYTDDIYDLGIERVTLSAGILKPYSHVLSLHPCQLN